MYKVGLRLGSATGVSGINTPFPGARALMQQQQKPQSSPKLAAHKPTSFGGTTHNVSRNRARKQVLPQAQKLHVYGSGAFGAFGGHESDGTPPLTFLQIELLKTCRR